MAVRRPPTTFSDDITAADLAANSVTASELADNAVDTAAIADDAVTNAKVGASAIGATELASNAVTTAKITDANITAAKVASSAITKEKIAAEAIEVKPHIKYGMLYPAIKDGTGTVRLSDGVTAHSGTVYGTAQSDGKKYYYTDIKGSKPIKDPRIGGHFGSQRHKFKSVQKLEQESATHGTTVYSVDGREWCRVSATETANMIFNGDGGSCLQWPVESGSVEFIEITGYFNDFNCISRTRNIAMDDINITVNGTTTNSGDTDKLGGRTTDNSPLRNRFVDMGSVINVGDSTVKTNLGTTPKINTIKIEAINTGSEYWQFFGIELIAQDTTDATRRNHVNIPAQNVVSYGKRFSVGSDTPTNAVHKHWNPFAFKTDGTTAWASGAHNGTSLPVGTGSSHNIDTATSLGLDKWLHSSNYYKPYNGGRVVIWVDSAGAIKTSVTVMPPNARSIMNSNVSNKANASIANNTYLPTFEAGATDDFSAAALTEVAKTFNYREFGNGAANGGAGATWADASMLDATDNIAFIMDDGLSALTAEDVNSTGGGTLKDLQPQADGDGMYITFIGTGVTIENTYNGGAIRTVAQNLPYGTHVLKYFREDVGGSTADPDFTIDGVNLGNPDINNYGPLSEVTFHQPKKPPVPDDACILADYMLYADWVPLSGAITTGTICKGARRTHGSRDVFVNRDSGTNSPSLAMNTTNSNGSANFGFRITAGVGSPCSVDLPVFSNKFALTAENPAGGSQAVSFGGSSSTISVLDNSANDDLEVVVGPTSATDLGVNKIEYTLAGEYHFSGFDSAGIIHTSSHYQTFETPFTTELVGGDRNMEQTNLVVTADGKSWDKVTRDTSYIGNMVLNISADHTTNIGGTTVVVFDEIRGFGLSQEQLNHFYKDFAIAYDRQICLRDGEYVISYSTQTAASLDRITILVNGNLVWNGYSNLTSNWSQISGSASVILKRGDYVQIKGGYYHASNSAYSSYHIERA